MLCYNSSRWECHLEVAAERSSRMEDVMPRTKRLKPDEKRKELASRPDHKSALEALERFAKMVGGELTKPSGIVRQSARGRWQGTPPAYPSESAYSSRGHGTAK